MASSFAINDGDFDAAEQESIEAKSEVDDGTMCTVCGEWPKMIRQCYCKEARARDVGSAERDAKRQGKESANCFRKLKARGGLEFINMMHTYKAKCVSPGRGHKRPAFDHVGYYLAFVVSTRVRKGSESLCGATRRCGVTLC